MLKKTTNTISISSAVELCLEKNLIFAAYRLPNKQYSEIVIQTSSDNRLISKNDSYYDIKGFLVAPFIETEKYPAFLIKPDIYASEFVTPHDYNTIKDLKAIDIKSNHTEIPIQIEHDKYLEQIECVIEQIKNGSFEKVVLSRVKTIRGDYISQLNKIFSKLIDTYPNAFVFVFNAGSHLWIGATPEPLLKANNGTMHTVSLAGTRTYSEQNLNIGAWNSKERLEQEYVTRYISKVLSEFNLIDVNLEGPYTKIAGDLVHLRTDYTFRSNELRYCLGEFLRKLHPTPAVCGMPRKKSLDLIIELEKHSREYYAGFIGPVGLNEDLTLFVNLRCMKVFQDNLVLFVGGGITADSIAEDEWLETEMKANTLISILNLVKQ